MTALGATVFAPAALVAQTPAALPAIVAQPSTVAPLIAVARPSAAAPGAALPANTEIWLSPNSEVNTKTIKLGDKFEMSVSRDVMLGDYVVTPRNTRAYGQITYRTGKGAFGKSAKMEFEIVDIDLGGRLIPVKGHYRVEGQGNTGATVGVVVAAGVLGAFVTGHSASVAAGTEYKAYTTDSIPVALAAPAPRAVAVTAVSDGPNPAIIDIPALPRRR